MQHGTFSRRDIAAWQQESPSGAGIEPPYENGLKTAKVP
jgi:hypothetical protein